MGHFGKLTISTKALGTRKHTQNGYFLKSRDARFCINLESLFSLFQIEITILNGQLNKKQQHVV